MRLKLIGAILLACILLPTFQPTHAQTTLRVATKPLDPFVIRDGQQVSGFSVQLWEQIASQADFKYEWVMFETVREVLDAVETGKADIGIAGISITSQRESKLDFSIPMYNAGLQVMTRAEASVSLTDALVTFFSPALLQTLGLLAGLIFLAAHTWWFFERGKDPNVPYAYLSGVTHALWNAALSVVTLGFGEVSPRSRLGRLFSIMWMIIGIAIIANFTAVVTTNFTLNELRGSINGLDDLYGKPVATVKGTTSADYLRGRGLNPREVDTIQAAYTLLESRQVDGVVYDAPVLQFYASKAGRGKVRVVGEMFSQEYYGIAMAQGSPHRETISRALLTLREKGAYVELTDRWFKPATR